MNNQSEIEMLAAHNLVPPNVQLKSHNESQWYIRILLTVCGWLSAIFILGFIILALVNEFDNEEQASLYLGAITFGIALVIFKLVTMEFMSQLGLALSVAGQSLLFFGLFEVFDISFLNICLLFTLFNIITLYFVEQYEYRFICSIFIAIGFGFILNELDMVNFYSSLLMTFVGLAWIYRLQLSLKFKNVSAILYGTSICLIQIKTSAIMIGQGVFSLDTNNAVLPLLDESLNVVSFVVLSLLLVKKQTKNISQKAKTLLYLAIALFSIVSFFAHGLSLAVLLVLIALCQSNIKLMALGILAGIINLSSYYYLVDYSLLEKSLLLFITGCCCLLISQLSVKARKSEDLVNE